MKKILPTAALLLLLAGTASAQTTPGNTSAAPRTTAPRASSPLVTPSAGKTRSTLKASKSREKELKRETRMVQREHARTENHIDAQNKARIKEAHKEADGQAR